MNTAQFTREFTARGSWKTSSERSTIIVRMFAAPRRLPAIAPTGPAPTTITSTCRAEESDLRSRFCIVQALKSNRRAQRWLDDEFGNVNATLRVMHDVQHEDAQENAMPMACSEGIGTERKSTKPDCSQLLARITANNNRNVDRPIDVKQVTLPREALSNVQACIFSMHSRQQNLQSF